MAQNKILLVEDDSTHAILMSSMLQEIPADVIHARTRSEAFLSLSSEDFDAVVLDLGLPDGSGFDVQAWLGQQEASPPIIFVTSDDLAEHAVKALRDGAQHYLVKRPNYIDHLSDAVASVLQKGPRSFGRQSERLADRIRGGSSEIGKVRRQIESYAASESAVLITGETGTGKELVARALHESSSRGAGPFVAVNCSAISDELFEAEVFGSARGSYTGSIDDRAGLVGAASGGTLFLDEIGDVSIRAQAKLLRFLENGRYRSVGDPTEKPADVRIVAATNQDINSLRTDRSFRSDLYYRLAVLRIVLPPLRERREDIEPLAQHFLEATTTTGSPREIVPAARQQLLDWEWPGNVRELQHTIERTLLHAEPGPLRRFAIDDARSPTQRGGRALTGASRHELESLLGKHNGRLRPVAKELGISVRTVQRRLKSYGLRLMDFRG